MMIGTHNRRHAGSIAQAVALTPALVPLAGSAAPTEPTSPCPRASLDRTARTSIGVILLMIAALGAAPAHGMVAPEPGSPGSTAASGCGAGRMAVNCSTPATAGIPAVVPHAAVAAHNAELAQTAAWAELALTAWTAEESRLARRSAAHADELRMARRSAAQRR